MYLAIAHFPPFSSHVTITLLVDVASFVFVALLILVKTLTTNSFKDPLLYYCIGLVFLFHLLSHREDSFDLL